MELIFNPHYKVKIDFPNGSKVRLSKLVFKSTISITRCAIYIYNPMIKRIAQMQPIWFYRNLEMHDPIEFENRDCEFENWDYYGYWFYVSGKALNSTEIANEIISIDKLLIGDRIDANDLKVTLHYDAIPPTNFYE